MSDLTLEELKALHDKAFNANQASRLRAADDRIFARVTQWDDALLEGSQLAYRGEFNIIRKAQRQIIAELRSNPVQVDFVPKDDERDDGADLLDGLYLTDDRRNSSLEAYDNACQEAVDCGLGGWELYTEYETNRAGDKNQVIRRRPIYEANNTSFPDPNAKLLDKSDAKYWSLLHSYSLDGYKALYKELTGEETDAAPENFASPEQSYTFPWVGSRNELYYVVSFYHKTLVKDKVLTLTDPMGQPLRLRESDLTEIMDELIDQGYEITDEKVIKRWQVKRYIASGEKILKVEVIAGDKIPVVHTYGERAFVEGEEYWEGVVRLAKDPQRLRNFVLSYIADIASRSPRNKPIFGAEQIAGFEHMYQQNGADNNYPYLLQHLKSNSEPLPHGPVGTLEAEQIPQSLAALADLTRQAVEDVANPGLPDQFSDPDLSGYAIELLQAKFDEQSIVYQQNLKHAKRWDAEIYASMASTVYDAPRKVMTTLPDGTRKTVEIMETILDEETGELVTLNDLTNMEFDVYADVGPSYASKKERTREELGKIAMELKDTDPAMHRAVTLKRLLLVDGVDMEDIREYGKKQLLLAGFREPETDEERAFLEQAMNQPEKPDANVLLAQAEMEKAKASQMREQRMAWADQQRDINEDARVQIEAFRAETERGKVQVEAEKVGADIDLTRAKVINTQADTMQKMTERFRARINP